MNKRNTDKITEIFPPLFCLYALCLFGLWYTDKVKFWKWLIVGATIVVAIISFFVFRQFLQKKRIKEILVFIQKNGLKEKIDNFINRWGLEGKSTHGWTFRSYKFDWNRINDFEKELLLQRVPLKKKDIYKVLKYHIQKKEEKLTRESTLSSPQKFERLNGTDFEKLLYRLFGAMGYVVELIGRTGDQGGDLIINKNGERTLIQAKCYRDWSVGNSAVQQVTGAMKHYDCQKTMVVTTSTKFTKEARELAQSNQTELISKNRLSEMLLKYLHENWV